MRFKLFIGVAALGLLGLGVLGCSGGGAGSDPIAAQGEQVTVAPEATQGPEAAAAAEAERQKKQEEADRKAQRGK